MTVDRPSDGNEIAALYDRWAASYDSDPNTTRDLCAQVLRREFAGSSLGDVVELGCGTGANTAWLTSRSRTVTAVDFSDGMLAVARGRVHSPSVQFIRQDISLPWVLGDQSADQVISTLVLEHVDALDHVFREVYRTLRSGGEAFICELHPYRQMMGGQAHFTLTDTGQTARIPAFAHDVAELVNAAIAAGLIVMRLDDCRDRPDESKSEPPRLLAMLCRRSS